MIITKENLLADKEGLIAQRNGIANTIHYIDGLLAFLERPELHQEIKEAPLNPEVTNAEEVPVSEPSENPDLGVIL